VAHLQPVAEYLTEDEAREYLTEQGEETPEDFYAGWYSRLSAPGYLDCTDWSGPFTTEKEAFTYVCELYDVDENGDEIPEEG